MEHSPPPFFKTGPTPLARLLIFSALSFMLLAADARFGYLAPLRQFVSIVVYPFQRIAAAPADILRRIGEFFVTHSSLREENARLLQEMLANSASLLQLKALQAENRHLRELLAARSRITPEARPAEVLYAARDPFSRKVIIDQGARNEVKAGQAVADARGVVGQVTRVYPWLAEVTLLTDKGHAVPVQNLRSGLRGVLFGVGHDGTLELRFMPLSADVQPGDQLVTSGIDGTYPPGLPVAEVTTVERDAALMFARIHARPLSGVASHTHVLVLSWQRDVPELPAEPAPQPKRRKGKKG
ncbi:MAG: rod shape-determining protein MreC [Betaproteobacteria bacterium]|nr:rod shape-determining protein MreC [Betaproteobacteria bacterium]